MMVVLRAKGFYKGFIGAFFILINGYCIAMVIYILAITPRSWDNILIW